VAAKLSVAAGSGYHGCCKNYPI